MKKLIGILLVLTLMLSLTSIAMATDITVNGGADGSEYAAYALLNVTDGGDGKFAYTFNEKYTAILQSVTGATEQADVVAYISALDADGIREFSDAVYAAILAADPAIEADYTSVDGAFAEVAQAYYLIAETKVGDESDTFSLVMLDTAGAENITVNTKEDKPSVEKKVKEMNDSTGFEEWGDSADYDFGDVIAYTIEGRVSNKYANYSSYYYSINDDMEKGLTYNEDAKIYVVNGENSYDVTSYFKMAVSTNEETGYANGFVAECNLKELDEACEDFEITADTTIWVEYSVTLNEYAVAGPEGNKNFVYLEYENNPYVDADGDINTPDRPGSDEPGEGGDEPGGDQPGDGGDQPGKTEIDTNIVFTFDAVVNKVDKNGNALAGAGFTLYKWIKGEDNGSWEQVGEEITGVTTFTFESLDAGQYKLEETTVPNGYNKCEDIEFEVVGVYDKTTDPHTLTALQVLNKDGEDISTGDNATFNATLALGQVSTNVINSSDEVLPGTGGIGTTIFYVVGAALVLGAVVLLITKKRMGTEE